MPRVASCPGGERGRGKKKRGDLKTKEEEEGIGRSQRKGKAGWPGAGTRKGRKRFNPRGKGSLAFHSIKGRTSRGAGTGILLS